MVAMAFHGAKPSERFMLWVDAVGGYWVCLKDEVVLGQPGEQGEADIPILADLSGRHARIGRDGEGYWIEALRDVRLDGRPVGQRGWLRDGSRIELGSSVRLVFRRPHPLSATARLEFTSRHRTRPASDGVLLMADCCVLGPKPNSHIVCREWPREVILVRQEETLVCHTAGPLEIDGISSSDRGGLLWTSRVAGEGFSFSLEPIQVECRQ